MVHTIDEPVVRRGGTTDRPIRRVSLFQPEDCVLRPATIRALFAILFDGFSAVPTFHDYIGATGRTAVRGGVESGPTPRTFDTRLSFRYR